MDQPPRRGDVDRASGHSPDPVRAASRSPLLLPVVAALASAAPLLFDAAQRSGSPPGWSSSFAWLGCGLLGASLLLMVREPAVARAFGGLERMYRWHHVLGTVAYALLLAHPHAVAAQRLPLGADAAWRALGPAGAGLSVWLGWISLLGLMAVFGGRRHSGR